MKKSEVLIPVTKPHMPSKESYMELAGGIWDNCWLTNRGPLVRQLEEQLIQRLRVTRAIAFANGHLALDCLIRSMQLGEGEVITTPFTFISTTNAIVMNGLNPVFCDVKASDCTIDEDKIEALITENTKAIVPVHVYGFPCNHKKIQDIADKYGLKVIYDAAHAFGVEVNGQGVGNFGDASMFSLHATKVFNAVEGGLVTFKDAELETKLCSAQNFGLVGQEQADQASVNAKMSEFHAAMGLANLQILEEQTLKRRELIEHYLVRLSGMDDLECFRWDRPEVVYNYIYFPVLVGRNAPVSRNELAARLLDEYNVQVRKYFYPIMSDFNCYKAEHNSMNTPIAKDISDRIMTLPLYVDLSHEQIDYICDAIQTVISG